MSTPEIIQLFLYVNEEHIHCSWWHQIYLPSILARHFRFTTWGVKLVYFIGNDKIISWSMSTKRKDLEYLAADKGKRGNYFLSECVCIYVSNTLGNIFCLKERRCVCKCVWRKIFSFILDLVDDKLLWAVLCMDWGNTEDSQLHLDMWIFNFWASCG